jgi:hypothetical protein
MRARPLVATPKSVATDDCRTTLTLAFRLSLGMAVKGLLYRNG